MARRRINTRFVTIFFIVAACTVGAVVLAQKLFIHDHADIWVTRGEQAMREQRWSDAATALTRATNLDPRNVKSTMMLATAYERMGQVDPDKENQALMTYQRALEIDPNYLPALKALIQAYESVLANPETAKAEYYQRAIGYAEKAKELDPTDVSTIALPSELLIQEWLGGLQVDPDEINQAMTDLRHLMEKNPGNADLVFNVARTKLQQGLDLTRKASGRVQPPEATAYFHEAVDVFEKAIAGNGGPSQDSSAALHFRFAQVLQMLVAMDASDPGNPAKYSARSEEEVKRARALAKPKDPDYLGINEWSGELTLIHHHRDEAIAVFRAIGDDPGAQLRLAGILGDDTKERPEAERILQNMMSRLVDDPSHIGGLRLRIMVEQGDLWINDYLEMKDSPDKQAFAQKIQDTIDKLVGSQGSHMLIEVRRLQTRYQLISGEDVQVIETLSPVMADDPKVSKDKAIREYMAQAYANAHQTAKAIKLLQDVVADNPVDIDARMFLAQLLVRDEPDQAAGALAELDQLDPTDARVAALHLELMLTGQSDPTEADAKKYFDQLPEDTPRAIASKAQMAMQLKSWDQSMRLLDESIKADPTNEDAYFNLATLLFYAGNKEKALAAAQRGSAAIPQSQKLQLLIAQIKGEDAKVIGQMEEKFAEQTPDPVERELKLSQMAAVAHDPEGQEKHLKLAEEAGPESPRVWGAMFDFYLRNGRLDAAAAYVPKLAAANYDDANGEVYAFYLARARGDAKGSLEIAQKLTQDKPEFAISWISLGQCLEEQGNYAQAIVQFGSALDRQASNEDAYRGLIECSYGLNKRGDALRYIQEGLAKMPDDAVLREMMVVYQLNYGNPQDAITVLRTEIQRSPNSSRLYSALGSVYVRVARTLRAQHRDDDATKLLQEAVNFMELAIKQFPDEQTLYESLAEAAVEWGQPGDAERVLKEWAARPIWRLRPEPFVKLAMLYEQAGQHDAAEAAMRTAMVRSDYRMDFQLQMADLLASHKKFDDAMELLRSPSGNPDRPEVRVKMVQVMVAEGKMKDAQAELQAELDKKPPYAGKLEALWAQILLEQKDYPGAISHATAALGMEPDSGPALYTRAVSYLHSDPADAQDALADLTHLHQLAPDNQDVKLQMVSTYMQLNMLDEAAVQLESILRTEPNNKAVRMMLVQIYGAGSHPRLSQALYLLQEVENTPPFDKDPDIFEAEAVILGDMDEIPRALANSDKAINLDPKSVILVKTRIDLLVKAERYQDVLDQLAQLDPATQAAWWALLGRAVAENHLQNTAAAQADINKAFAAAVQDSNSSSINQVAQVMSREMGDDQAIAALKPYADSRLQTKLTLALIYHRKGDEANAAALSDDVINKLDTLSKPDQIAAMNIAGQIYQTLEPEPQVDKAYNVYQRWLKIDPQNIEALNNLACLLADNYNPPRIDEGLKYVQIATDRMTNLGQTDPTVEDTEGWLLILSGDAQKGVDELNKAIETKAFPEAYFHLGEGYLRLEFPDEAAKDAQLALDLLDKQKGTKENSKLRAKLKDLVVRSEKMSKEKQQAQVP